MSLRKRIVAYYSLHNPQKLDASDFPDRLIAAYRKEKRLSQLVYEMCAKYGHAEYEWVVLGFENLDEAKRRDTATNNAVHQHVNDRADFDASRTPHSEATTLPTPSIVKKTRCAH